MTEPEKMTSQRFTVPMLMQGLCFALCFFAFQLTEFTINDRAGLLLGASKVNAVYSIGIACTALGFLSFALLRRLFRGEAGRRLVIGVVGLVSVISAIMVVMLDTPAPFLICSFLALLSFGCIGGSVYYHMAMTFANSPCIGRVVGMAAGCAVLAQFTVQNLFITDAAFITGIVLSVVLLIYFMIKPPKDWVLQNPLPFSAENKTDKNVALTLVLAVLLMSLLVGLIDGVVVSLHATGQVSVSSLPRLFYALGLLLAGFIADLEQRRYLPLATVCFMFISTISNTFLAASPTYFWCVACMYLYCGFYVIFLTVMFMDFAPRTGDPALWAGMGRVVRSATTALTAIPTLWLFKAFGSTALVVGSCLLSIAILLLLFPHINRAFWPGHEHTLYPNNLTPPPQKSFDQMLADFSARYDLTPREADVLAAAVYNDKAVKEIAGDLKISDRMVQRYFTSIYEKTGAQGRVSLTLLYSGRDEFIPPDRAGNLE